MCDKRRNMLRENLSEISCYYSLVLMRKGRHMHPFVCITICIKTICECIFPLPEKCWVQPREPSSPLSALNQPLHWSNDPVLICLPLKCAERRPSIVVKSLRTPQEYSYLVRSALARSGAPHFQLPRHLKADAVCLPAGFRPDGLFGSSRPSACQMLSHAE